MTSKIREEALDIFVKPREEEEEEEEEAVSDPISLSIYHRHCMNSDLFSHIYDLILNFVLLLFQLR